MAYSLNLLCQVCLWEYPLSEALSTFTRSLFGWIKKEIGISMPLKVQKHTVAKTRLLSLPVPQTVTPRRQQLFAVVGYLSAVIL